MKNLIKHKLIFITILCFFSTQSLAGDKIIPVPKPAVNTEIKKKVADKKFLYPQKKPLKKIDEIPTETTEDKIEVVKGEYNKERCIEPRGTPP